MSTIAINDTIPEGTFKYVPYSPELEQPGVSTLSFCTVISDIDYDPVVRMRCS